MDYDTIYIIYALGFAAMIVMLPTVFQKVLVKPCLRSKTLFVVMYLIAIPFSWLGVIYITAVTRTCKCGK